MKKKAAMIIAFLKKESIALFFSSMTIILLFAISAILSDWYYNTRNRIPNPVERGPDLGLGLFVASFSIGSLFVSIPISIAIHCYILSSKPMRKLK